MDAAYSIAEHLATVTYKDLPADVVEATKRSILDTLGVILGDSGTVAGVKELVALVKEAGGKEESTIIAFGGKVPAWMAAFTNGAMAHGLDYDDVHWEAVCHLGAPIVPAAFAIAERVGGVNGMQFITAIALGQDLMARIGVSLNDLSSRFNWHTTPVWGVFGAAAASGKLLGLDRDKLVDAFGIALCQAAGTMELRWGVGSDLAGMYPAFPCKGGVLSALMAQKGITGVKNSFEGRGGLFNSYFNGEYSRDRLLADLGRKFEGSRLSFKVWPSCGGTHNSIDATLGLVIENDIQAEDVQEIIVHVSRRRCLPLCEPLEARRKPETTLDAKYSIPFCVAAAVARRKVTIGDFTEEGRKDPLTLELAQKVIGKHDPEMDAGAQLTVSVQIRTKDGKTYQRQSDTPDTPSGHFTRRISQEALVEKFRDCASYAAKLIAKENIEKAIELINKLEQVDDVSQIIRLLG